MEEKRQRHIDIQNLKRHQEFWAFKQELELFCDELESIKDLDLNELSRVSVGEEIAGRLWAANKVRELLSTLGLIDKTRTKVIDRTGE